MKDSKIFGGIVEPQALNPQIVDITLRWGGDPGSFMEEYRAYEDALYPDKPKPLPEKVEPERHLGIEYPADNALVERFRKEYDIGHSPIFGSGASLLWEAFTEMNDIRESANTIRTLDEFDALILRWRAVSKNVAFLEKKNVERVIGGLERVVDYQTSGPEKRYVAAGIAMLKRLA